ncbi:MAG TPA: TIGR03087 family PEP-CTERM/XrtA system glycosyltransferase [Isosphaeraceae bacterium]|jgi:sugar transferase (PEP-CTERM/EpsH1 system associated)
MESEEFEGRAGREDHPCILYLTHRLPYPPDKGDRIRNYHVLDWLSRRYAVHLACLADEPVGRGAIEHLRGVCARVAIVRVGGWARRLGALTALVQGRTATEGAFAVPRLRAVLRRWSHQTPFAAALASTSGLAPYLRMEELRAVPAVVDLVDVDSQKWLDYAAAGRGPRAWLHALEGRRVRDLERNIAGWARAITLVSRAEAELYRRACGPGPVHAITNGVDLDYFRPDPDAGDEEPSCVFVGALDYRPNVDAVVWFCREVWPAIRGRQPRAHFALVGRQPAPEVRRLAALPGVELVGQVPDVRPHVARAAVVIAPLRMARGVQNKVLEALAMAKPTVASPQAVTGLNVAPGIHVQLASTPTEWVEVIGQLWEEPEARRSLGAAGRQYVEQHHRWDRCLDSLDPLLRPKDASRSTPPSVQRIAPPL